MNNGIVNALEQIRESGEVMAYSRYDDDYDYARVVDVTTEAAILERVGDSGDFISFTWLQLDQIDRLRRKAAICEAIANFSERQPLPKVPCKSSTPEMIEYFVKNPQACEIEDSEQGYVLMGYFQQLEGEWCEIQRYSNAFVANGREWMRWKSIGGINFGARTLQYLDEKVNGNDLGQMVRD
jgi:hypothetical protein